MMYKDRNFYIKSLGQRLFLRLTFLFLVYWALNFHLVQSHDILSSGKCKKIFAADLRSNAGHRLTNSVVNKKVHALSQIHCMFQCNRDPCCRSTNFRKGDSSNGKENCELLHALASEQPQYLKQDKDYDYCILLEPERLFNCSCLLCKNNGRCETSKKLCSCDSGFTGKQCEKDIDECSLSYNRCHQNSTCKNTVGSYTCTCNQGFTGNGTNCTEVDECSSNSNRCHQNSTCNNTVGSYTCTCNQGFTGNGTNCTDVDECNLSSNHCHENSTCKNTVGSYTCTCNEGFTGNGTNCTDIDECSLNSNPCHQNSTCKNTVGCYTCTCNRGFTGSGTNCTDVDECNSSSDLCHQNSTCKNTVGSYTCTCNEGFAESGINCTDVDECRNSNSCHQNSTCKNTVGSYTCTCNQGFTGNGTKCTDIDECSSNSNRCHQNSTCHNVLGSYICTCNKGFTGNGINCTGTFVAKFTNLGASGRLGPTSLGSFYAGQDHENMVTVVNGTQYWTVPFTGIYQITAVGASGGYNRVGPAARGRGAYMKGDFDLNKGEVIKILVGQQGVRNTRYSSAGGGGGTFVVTSSNKPVIIAGGGGGIQYLKTRLSNCDASVGTSGKKNQCDKTKRNCSNWSGGVNGSGALEADKFHSGGGGGGFYSNGRSGRNFGGKYGNGGEGGKSFLQGGAGGRAKYNNAVGGFGGGGGAYGAGGGAGGGGGYSGGASGDNRHHSCAGGGGSYNSGRNQENSEGFQDNGHGYVEINRIFPDV